MFEDYKHEYEILLLDAIANEWSEKEFFDNFSKLKEKYNITDDYLDMFENN